MNRVSNLRGGKPREHFAENSLHHETHQTAEGLDLFARHQNSLISVGRRRWILRAGLAGIAGLSLPKLLQARESSGQNGNSPRATSVIQIWLSGGPSQIDMWDMKP